MSSNTTPPKPETEADTTRETKPSDGTNPEQERTTFRFHPESYRYLGKDGEGYAHHAELDQQWILVCDTEPPAHTPDSDGPVEIAPGEVDRIQTDDLEEFGDFLDWIDHVEEHRGWQTLQFDIVELQVYAIRDRTGVSLTVGQRERTDVLEPGYLDPADLDSALALLEERVDKRRLADGTQLALLWLNWTTYEVEHAVATNGGTRAGLTDEVVADAISARHDVSMEDHEVDADSDADAGTNTDADAEEPTPADAEEATAQLRTLDEGTAVTLNGRTQAIEVTATPEDPTADDATIELAGNGTTYEIELEARYVPTHSMFGATCSWVWTENADRPEPVTDVEICS